MPAGTLYIVATPIGNLEDMTFRGIRTLKEVDLIAAEDTRHSRKLLSHYGIATRMTPYHDHNEQLKSDYLLELLGQGQNIAIITDAGTPCVADPGYRLVNAAINAGFEVVPIPGASAAIAALSASGLPSDRFAFEGFLPQKQGKRVTRLEELKTEYRTLIFYEAPHRIEATLKDMLSVLGNRTAVLAREITKIHEEFRSGTLLELIGCFTEIKPRGEFAILLAPYEKPDPEPLYSSEDILRQYILTEQLSVKDAVARAAKKSDLSKSELYAMALRVKDE